MSPDEVAAVGATRARLSTMWIFVMLNIVVADIFSFISPGFLQQVLTGHAGGVQVTEGFLLAAAVVIEIPIAMVLLSRLLPYRLNRWLNIVAALVTIAYVIGGGSTKPHYLFFATVEVVCCLFIVWIAWRWSPPEEVTDA